MIQDIAPHCYHNEYRPTEPDGNSYLMYFEKHNALADWEGENIEFPRFRDFPEVKQELSENIIYLFTIDEQRFYLAKELELPERRNFRLESSRRFRDARPQWLSFAGITGYQLWHWYDTRKFCGHCGCPMVHDTKERMMRCPDCGQTHSTGALRCRRAFSIPGSGTFPATAPRLPRWRLPYLR